MTASYTEPRSVGTLTAAQGSVDNDTYPWRVVGVGDRWEVHGRDGRAVFSHGDVHRAHAEARALKVLHPRGVIEADFPNIGRPLNTAADRLAGRAFVLHKDGEAPRHFHAFTHQPAGARLKVCDHAAGGASTLFLPMIATDHTAKLSLDWVQFSTTYTLEMTP